MALATLPAQVASEGLPTLGDSGIAAQMPPANQAVFLGAAALIMGLGTIYFLVKATQVRGQPEAQEYVFVTTLVSGTAFAAYTAMFLGFGDTAVTVTFPGGAEETLRIYWARYADWLFTTPLLLIDLALLAGYELTDPPVAALISADGIMIVAGVVGAFTPVFSARLVWWAISTIAFVFVVYLLWRALTAGAMRFDDESRQSTFITLRNLTILLWTAYPIVWIIGTEGVGAIPLSAETAAYAVLDVLAKVGFGIILLNSRAILSPEDAPSAEPATAD